MTWIQTYSGKRFDLLDPLVEQVDAFDIAHALSRICRFTGHTGEHYSVAQHCVHVAEHVPPHAKLQALLHDAHEAYVGDVSSPLKVALRHIGGKPGAFDLLEAAIQRCVFAAFDVPEDLVPEVKEADLRMLMTEKQLLTPEPEPWGINAEPYNMVITPWSADYARGMYYWRLAVELTRDQHNITPKGGM